MDKSSLEKEMAENEQQVEYFTVKHVEWQHPSFDDRVMSSGVRVK